jgi:soluble lytic murein transglycosylase-like protein
MKGAAVASKGDDKAKDDSAIALPATELPDADAYLNASKRDALDNAAGMRQRLVRAVLQHPNVPTVEPLIRQAASKHGIDPALVKAVIAAESGFNPQAVSPKGAIGLMQVIPDTGARYGVTGDARRTAAQKLADPKTNITTGVRYLSDLLRMFSGNLELVLAAYNAGEGAVQKHGNDIPPYAETQNYVKRILGTAEDYRRLYGGGVLKPVPLVAPAPSAAPAKKVRPPSRRRPAPATKTPPARRRPRG